MFRILRVCHILIYIDWNYNMFKGFAILIYIFGGVTIPFVVRAYGKITKLEYCDAVK